MSSSSNVAVLDYFESQATADSTEKSDLWRECAQLYSKRLWHQLTVTLAKLIDAVRKDEAYRKPGELLQIYHRAIQDFEAKINPFTLVCLCQPLLIDCVNSDASIKFLEMLGEKVKKGAASAASSAAIVGNSVSSVEMKSQIHLEAFTFIRILQGRIYLMDKKDVAKTKVILEECEAGLENIDGVVQVHKDFYLLASEMYKIEGDHANYYASSLRYLGCSELDERDDLANANLAVHLCLAALLGKNVFNFGELLAHPIVKFLKGRDNEWLVSLVEAFNRGDVAEFRALKKFWGKQTDLTNNEETLYEKICLLSVMEMTFRRSATDRQLTFADVAEHTGLSKDKIELLVMKALSRELIKGQIDQVEETVNVSWVQPRVLDKSQLGSLMSKLDNWCESIGTMEKLIETNAGDILTV